MRKRSTISIVVVALSSTDRCELHQFVNDHARKVLSGFDDTEGATLNFGLNGGYQEQDLQESLDAIMDYIRRNRLRTSVLVS